MDSKTNPIAIASEGKSTLGMMRRAIVISSRYGVTSSRMHGILNRFAQILDEFSCGATFTIPAVALNRGYSTIRSFKDRNIEFAVHGNEHIDHTRLSPEGQKSEFSTARRVFDTHGLAAYGFRSPYLRWNQETLTALSQNGYLYDSSQALAWPVRQELQTSAYLRALDFYGAVSAKDYPALPVWTNGLVRIPYCLPDDEALVDRFRLEKTAPMAELWLDILEQTYQRGEVFTLGLHPERLPQCAGALTETLRRARSVTPTVWITRLDEVARWWKQRTQSQVMVANKPEGDIHLKVDGPPGLVLLARGLKTTPAGEPWCDGYFKIPGTEIELAGQPRPFIGVHSETSPVLTGFLRQQGYIVEITDQPLGYSIYLDQKRFSTSEERGLLDRIEQDPAPIVRLSRWPNATKSVLVVTGDIDALNIWDYVSRISRT